MKVLINKCDLCGNPLKTGEKCFSVQVRVTTPDMVQLAAVFRGTSCMEVDVCMTCIRQKQGPVEVTIGLILGEESPIINRVTFNH